VCLQGHTFPILTLPVDAGGWAKTAAEPSLVDEREGPDGQLSKVVEEDGGFALFAG